MRLHDAGVAALRGDAVEVLVHGDRVGGHLLGGAVVPLADHLDHVPLLARGLERLVDAVVAVGSTEVPATPRTSRILPPFGRCLISHLAQQHAEALLVDVDVDGVFGVEDVVEGDQDDAGVAWRA